MGIREAAKALVNNYRAGRELLQQARTGDPVQVLKTACAFSHRDSARRSGGGSVALRDQLVAGRMLDISVTAFDRYVRDPALRDSSVAHGENKAHDDAFWHACTLSNLLLTSGRVDMNAVNPSWQKLWDAQLEHASDRLDILERTIGDAATQGTWTSLLTIPRELNAIEKTARKTGVDNTCASQANIDLARVVGRRARELAARLQGISGFESEA